MTLDRERIFAVFELNYQCQFIGRQRSHIIVSHKNANLDYYIEGSRISETASIQNEKVRVALGRSLNDRSCLAQVDDLFYQAWIRGL